VLNVTSPGCNSTTAPSIAAADQLQSVPWALVGQSSTAVVAQIPACGSYVGWTDVPQGSNNLVQVQASVPYDPQCGSTSPVPHTINLVVPTGTGQTTVPHAPGGPIVNLQALASEPSTY